MSLSPCAQARVIPKSKGGQVIMTDKDSLNIAMLGHKHMLSCEGGI